MYRLKNLFTTLIIVGTLAVSSFIFDGAEAVYKPSGEEIAGVSVQFGPGYGGYYGPRRYGRWGYRRHGYYYPRYYYGRGPRYRYWRNNYYNPNYYYYGRPGGVYFYWR